MLLRLLRVLVLAGCACAATVPRHSPEFAVNMPDGTQKLLTQYRGKVVVLVFILTTCPHCQHTVGLLSKLQNEFGAQRLQVLAAAIEDNAKADVPGFIRQFRPAFPVGWSPRDSAVEYLQQPPDKGMRMPNLVFVDRGGTIRAQYTGDQPFLGGADEESNLRGEIDKLLKEAPAGRHPRK